MKSKKIKGLELEHGFCSTFIKQEKTLTKGSSDTLKDNQKATDKPKNHTDEI